MGNYITEQLNNARAMATQGVADRVERGMMEGPPPEQLQPTTPVGGPMQQSGLGGPVQGYQANGVRKSNGGQMTPAQAKKLAALLRNR